MLVQEDYRSNPREVKFRWAFSLLRRLKGNMWSQGVLRVELSEEPARTSRCYPNALESKDVEPERVCCSDNRMDQHDAKVTELQQSQIPSTDRVS